MEIKGLYFMSNNKFACLRCGLGITDAKIIITFHLGKDSRNLSRRVLHTECWAQVPDIAKQGIYELAWDIPRLIDREELV